MTEHTRKREGAPRRGRPAPAALRRAIKAGEDVDYDALMAWWRDDCPPWLAGQSPDLAALLSVLPGGPSSWGSASVVVTSTDG